MRIISVGDGAPPPPRPDERDTIVAESELVGSVADSPKLEVTAVDIDVDGLDDEPTRADAQTRLPSEPEIVDIEVDRESSVDDLSPAAGVSPTTQGAAAGAGQAQTSAKPAAEPAPKKPPPPPPPPKRSGSLPDASAFVPPASVASASIGAAPSAPPGPAAEASAPEPPKRRPRAWWDDLFGDDFLRTMDKLSRDVVVRETNFIEHCLGVEKGAVILDLACGAGQHAVELASRGYSVVGLDLSLAMLARAADEAQERSQKLNFLQGDMRDMAFEDMFDGVFCWATSFGYFEDDKNFAVLQRIHKALRKGGTLLLDVMNRDFVAPRQPSLVWYEGEGCICMDEMQVDFFTSRLKVKRTAMFEDGRSREVDYSIRLYGLHELGKMMRDAGFKVVEVSGHPAHPGVFFGCESPRVIILAERS